MNHTDLDEVAAQVEREYWATRELVERPTAAQLIAAALRKVVRECAKLANSPTADETVVLEKFGLSEEE